ncbi:MAG: ferrous iron transport protein A [Planctomycetota bacterium]
MNLNQAILGRTYRVRSVGGGALLARRLMEMGVFEGQNLLYIRQAPLGDPLEIEVDHTLLVLRRREALHVELEELA